MQILEIPELSVLFDFFSLKNSVTVEYHVLKRNLYFSCAFFLFHVEDIHLNPCQLYPKAMQNTDEISQVES